MQNLLALSSILLLFASCSKIQELDERTKNMEESTQKMQETTEEMAQSTSMMYKQKRQVDALFARDELFAKILDDHVAIEGKLSYAAKFHKAFEYQLWNGESFDTESYREELLDDAISEYFRQNLEIYNNLKESKNIFGKSKLERMSPLKTSTKRNYEAAFYAIATTMHMNNHHQEFVAHNGKEFEITSIYDIIVTALKKERNGENMPAYMEKVITGKNKELSLALLNARFNFLVALAVSDMTTQENMNVANKTQAFLFKLSGGKVGKIELSSIFETSNTVTQKQINEYLLAAIKTRTIIKDILDLDVKMDKTLQSVINNIDTNEMVIQASQTSEYIRFQNYILRLTN